MSTRITGRKKENQINQESKQAAKPKLPPDAELQMLRELETLAKRINDKEIDTGDASYCLKFNELKEKYPGTTLTSLRKSLSRFLPDLLTQSEEEEQGHDLDLLVGHDEQFTEEEISEAEKLLEQSDLFKEFHEDFKLTGYKADRQLTDAGLKVLGRTLLPTSSCEYGHGKLATGKTEFYNKVAGFFPKGNSLSLTTFTEKFLFYAGGENGNALQGFLLIYGESDMAGRNGEDSYKQQYVRQLLTENKITQGSVETEAKGKRHKAKYSVLHGPLIMVITGVDSPSRFDPQTASRLYSRHFKHTHESIKTVLELKAKKAASPKIEENTRLLKAERKWRCAFTLFKKYDKNHTSVIQEIKIPFLPDLIFKKKRLTEQDMRNFDRLAESIKVSALLHQKSRIIKDGVLEATWQDYINIQKSYLNSVPAAKGLGNDLLDKFLELLKWWQLPENAGPKTRVEIYRALNVNDNTGKKWFDPWIQAELLEDVTESDKKNAKKSYKLPRNAEELAIQMQEDEKLGIEDITLPENQRPIDIDGWNLSTREKPGWSPLIETNTEQVQTSANTLVNDRIVGRDPVDTGLDQLRPMESPTRSVIEDMNNHRSDDLGRHEPKEEQIRI